jgi:lysophosphatidylcholine acyltransferase/lyso-PAF acetyltransferase
MADNNSITSPLLTSDHLIVTIDSDSVSSTTTDTTPISNPFIALGCKDGELTVPAAITVDPFDNYKAGIEGLYEWLKTIVCLPIALIRLVIFGLCLAIGYVATKLALYGWKDKENPMPKWRCRIMWVTRISARFILFSFGFVP